ncbi:MAG: radical SAM protein [Dictyoglomi bacterium]|nr:radical SAM protein [Dictyoglomota bacterium]
MSNLAIHLLYRLINSHPYFSCERFFLSQDEIVPLSIESLKPLNEFDVIGISISYELDYFNVIKILESSHIPVFAKDRDLSYPLIIGGGACMNYNPEPIADIFDLILIGEAEDAIKEILDRYIDMKDAVRSKDDLLFSFLDIEGVYIPEFYKDGKPLVDMAPRKVKRRVFRDFDRETACSYIYSPDAVFGDMFLIEIERGCPMKCKFCVAGNIYSPCRIKSLDTVKDTILKYGGKYKKIGLMGPLVGGIPYIEELLKWLIGLNFQVSVSSLRVSTLNMKFLELLKLAGESTITIAPEFLDEKLRAEIGKKESNEKILEVLETLLKFGFRDVKFYMIFGYGDYEIELRSLEIFKKYLTQLLKDYKANVVFNFQPLVPKPFTPLQNYNIPDRRVLQSQKRRIMDTLKHDRIKVRVASIREALIEAALSRGGRDMLPLILKGDKRGIFSVTSAGIPWSFIEI